MKQSTTFIPTLREVPQDLSIKSCQMLLRAGYVRKQGAAISYLPLAKRVLNKIETIIREEFEHINAIEMELPSMKEGDLLTGIDTTLHDYHEFHACRNLNLITSIVSQNVKSYKNLPIMLYQIQTKFQKDESSRRGLFGSPEQLVQEAYSFHGNVESLQETYEKVAEVYARIATRLGLPVHKVKTSPYFFADESDEFVVYSELGEETIAISNDSSFKANIKVSPVTMQYEADEQVSLKALEKVETPGVETIKDLCEYLGVEPSECMKSLVLKADDEIIVALVRGDHQLNLEKLAKVVGARKVEMASSEEIKKVIGCSIGSIGPIKLPIDIPVIADYAIKAICNGISGANMDGYHYVNVNPTRDFAINKYADIRDIEEGDPSPDGQGEIEFKKALRIGQISKISPIFTAERKALMTNEEGKPVPMLIGCYQLEVTRLFATLAEIYQDDRGFKWPIELAPYDIHLMTASSKDELQVAIADQLYSILTTYRFHVLYDDRNKSAGVKFADSNLIGLPVRVTVGKKVSEGFVEVTIRENGLSFECAKEELIDRLNELFRTQ